MKLLLVDDDPDFRALIEGTAPSWLEIIACSCSREAVTALKGATARTIDVSMIDLRMEPFLAPSAELEGVGLLRWMLQEKRCPPSILVSADHDALLALEPGNAPVIGCLPKPLDLALLYRFLHAFRELFQDGTDVRAGKKKDVSL